MEQKRRNNNERKLLRKHAFLHVAFALVILSCILPFVSANWPTFHNTNNHTGLSNSTLDLTDFGLLWNFTTGLAIESSPTVVDGILYIATYDNQTYALNVTDGSVIWNISTLNVTQSAITIANGIAYHGSTNSRFFDGLTTVLTKGKIYARNATTGIEIWNTSLGYNGYSTPTFANDRLFFGNGNVSFFALNAITGTELWNVSIGNLTYSTPAIVNDTIYVGAHNAYLYAFNATTGEQIWNFSAGDTIFTSPAVADGRVYFVNTLDKLFALDAATGTELWNFTTDPGLFFGSEFSSPAVANDVVFIGSSGGNVHALNATTGAVVWNISTAEIHHSSPAIADDKLVIVGTQSVFVLDTATGNVLYTDTPTPEGTVIVSSPAIYHNTIYAAVYDSLFAYGPLCSDTDGDGVNTSTNTICGPIDCNDNDANIVPPVTGYVINRSITLCNGTYNLTTTGSNAVFTRPQNDIVITCNTTIISGGGSGSFIDFENRSNITLQNCQVQNYERGLVLTNITGAFISNNQFINIDSYVIGMTNVSDSILTNNTLPQFFNNDFNLITLDGTNNTLSYSNENGTINWTLNATGGEQSQLALGINPIISHNFVQANVSGVVNATATITFFDILGIPAPRIVLRDGTPCALPTCSNVIALGGNSYQFNVTSFSNYSISNETIAPTLTFISPTNGQTITDTTPTLQIQVDDSGTGLDNTSINLTVGSLIYVNDRNLTCTPDTANMTTTQCTVTTSFLSGGTQTLNVSACDAVFNCQDQGITFTINSLPVTQNDGGGSSDEESEEQQEEQQEEPSAEEQLPEEQLIEQEPLDEPEEAEQEPVEQQEAPLDEPAQNQDFESEIQTSNDQDNDDLEEQNETETIEQESSESDANVEMQIYQGWRVIYTEGSQIYPIVLKENSTLELTFVIENANTEKNIEGTLSLNGIPEEIETHIESLQFTLDQKKKYKTRILLKTTSLKDPFTFTISVRINGKLYQIPISILLEEAVAKEQRLQRERIILETKTVVTTSYRSLLFLTLLPLLFMLNMSTFVDQETLRRLLAEKHHTYTRIYVLPKTKDTYFQADVNQVNLSEYELSEAGYLTKHVGVSYDLACLIIAANKRLFPRVFTLEPVPLVIKKRYRHIFFVDARQMFDAKQIQTYIKTERKKGFSNQEIYQNLRTAGWKRETLAPFFNPLDELDHYIHTRVHQGISIDQIEQELTEVHWKRSIIKERLKKINEVRKE